MRLSEQTKDIFAALVKAQAEVEGALKDATNPAFKSKYADLSSVMDAAKGPLKNNGLALTIGLSATVEGVMLHALLAHSSGQFIEYDPFLVLVTKKDAQGQGSAITYGRRYLTMSILGIQAEDDDGNEAVKPAKPEPKPAPETKRTKTINHFNDSKPKLNPEQTEQIRAALVHAGTVDALLDKVVEDINGFIALNEAGKLFEGGKK